MLSHSKHVSSTEMAALISGKAALLTNGSVAAQLGRAIGGILGVD
jgi:hypothetical protein